MKEREAYLFIISSLDRKKIISSFYASNIKSGCELIQKYSADYLGTKEVSVFASGHEDPVVEFETL
jgi:hypothetical protein